jgi:hypothetical protein
LQHFSPLLSQAVSQRKKAVIPAKAGIQEFSNRKQKRQAFFKLEARFRGHEEIRYNLSYGRVWGEGRKTAMPKTRAKVIVKGIVQGVNFRYYT